MLTHLDYMPENLLTLLGTMTPQTQQELMMETIADLLLIVPRQDLIRINLSLSLQALPGTHQAAAELMHDLNSKYMVPCSMNDPIDSPPEVEPDEIYVYVVWQGEEGVEVEPIGFKLNEGH
jgi:hypothetical protein